MHATLPPLPRPVYRRLALVVGALLVATLACAPAAPTPRIASAPIQDADLTAPAGESDVAVTTPVTALPDYLTVVGHASVPIVTARVEPDRPEAVATFANPTERGGPLVFQVIDGQNVDAADWVEVKLPIRPNGTTGWVRREELDLTVNPYHIDIDTSEFTLTITRENEVVLQTTVAVGEGETPTPYGEFYLIELLQPPTPDGIYGPYAYGLSGFSDTLESFNGGEGVIGIHGTNQPELLGTTVSHGCIRVANDVITEMTEFLPLGTPVSIRH